MCLQHDGGFKSAARTWHAADRALCVRNFRGHLKPRSALTPSRPHVPSSKHLHGGRVDSLCSHLFYGATIVAAAACMLSTAPVQAQSFKNISSHETLQEVSHKHSGAYGTADQALALASALSAECHSGCMQQCNCCNVQPAQLKEVHINAPSAEAAVHQQDAARAAISLESIWYPLALSAAAGLSTSIGGFIAVSLSPDESTLAFLLGTAIGVMSTVSLVQLWVVTALKVQDPAGVTAAVAAGALLFTLLDNIMPRSWNPSSISTHQQQQHQQQTPPSSSSSDWPEVVSGQVPPDAAEAVEVPSNHCQTSSCKTTNSRYQQALRNHWDTPSTSINSTSSGSTSTSSSDETQWANTSPSELWRLGVLMAVTMTVHNLPEGFAVAFSAYTDIGPVMGLAIALHNIPEGLVIAAPVYAATNNRWQALALATASGLSEPVGAAAALLAAKPFLTTPQQIDYLLAATGGVMMMVCVVELWPEGRKCGRDAHMMQGILLGAAAMAWTLYIGV